MNALGPRRIMRMLMLGALGSRSVVNDISNMARTQRVDFKTAVRRAVGTSDWQHDPERVAAAKAKRERRRQRNVRNDLSMPKLHAYVCSVCHGDYRNPVCKECGGAGIVYG